MNELSITPREYQQKIFETCSKESCLVVLPTGTGKTLIAIMLAISRFKEFPLEKIVILAPTKPLVEQHFNSFKKELPEAWAEMNIFTGKTAANERKKLWQTSEFVFSTPQCIANDISKGLYSLEDVCLLVEDECHRCLKNYSYNFIAQKYKEQSKHQRILGLTASPGSDMETIKKVCANLGITAVEIRTRESPDVKPYLQKLEFEKIVVDFPPEFEEIRQLLKQIYDKKVSELRNRKALFSYASKVSLLEAQKRIFGQINSGNKNPNLLMSASVCSQAVKLNHALELLETQTITSFNVYMQKLFKEAQDKKSRGIERLVKEPGFAKAYTLATTLDFEHPKLQKLIEIITKSLENNKNAKIIVFSQYRETVNKIAESLNKIHNSKAKIFVGQAKKSNSSGKSTGLNQKEQKKIIEDFSKGEINILVATSIAEEGLDIPEVNEVIFYEPVPSAIRKIQRAGRTARLMPGSLKILITNNTRDIASHYASTAKEKRMHNVISAIKEDIDNRREIQDNLENQKKLF